MLGDKNISLIYYYNTLQQNNNSLAEGSYIFSFIYIMRTSSGMQDDFFILTTCEIALIELTLTADATVTGATNMQVNNSL